MKIKSLLKQAIIIIGSVVMSSNFIYAEDSIPKLSAKFEEILAYPLIKEVRYNTNDVVENVTVYEYDNMGNTTKKSYYTAPDAELSADDSTLENLTIKVIKEKFLEETRIEYKYENNKNGTKITETNYILNGNNVLAQTDSHDFQYDTNGNLTRYAYYDKGDLLIYNIYEYDDKNNCIKESTYNRDKTSDELPLTESISSEYNQKGNFTKRYYKTDKDNISQTIKYDEYDNLIQSTYYSEDGKLIRRFTYEYDVRGNLIKINEHTPSEAPSFEIFEYNNNNQLIKESSYSHNLLKSYYIYDYDLLGNQSKKSFYLDGAFQWTFTEEYDEINKIKHQEFYGNGNAKNFYSIYNYEDIGNLLSCYDFQDNNNLIGYTLYTYAIGETAEE
ncbi:hypothetical protein AN641_03955 [Candidatus Epulonipiscioides gigas]|nr:hypothetical protein AN641_03955 [Epulopiscium sp. SCG-C07WGA-EpuloA2]